MLKFWSININNRAIPGEISLCIELTGCPFNCKGCKTPYLREDKGTYLTKELLEELVKAHKSVSAVCFLGGDINPYILNKMASYVRKISPELKIGWYSGDDSISVFTEYKNFDYIKLGSYNKNRGDLNSVTTNQRFYKVEPGGVLRNMTRQFWIRK